MNSLRFWRTQLRLWWNGRGRRVRRDHHPSTRWDGRQWSTHYYRSDRRG